MDWVVYILRCADGTFYTGITNDFPRRLARHEQGRGAKYTRGRGPFTVLHTENQPDRAAASRREREIKAMDRGEKMAFICTHRDDVGREGASRGD